MFKKVLFPVIMNEFSEQIINCIGGLSANGAEEVLLFHVLSVSDLENGNVSQDRDESLLQKWKASLEQIGLRCEYRIVKGIPWLEIVELADRSDYSFVMLGSHGSTYLDRMFLGSVTENVVHHTGKPVFIYKLKKDNNPEENRSCTDVFRKVLFATDFSDYSSACTAYIDKMKNNLYQELDILHVQDLRQMKYADSFKVKELNRIDNERLIEMKAHFESKGFNKVTAELRTGYAMTEILNYATKKNCSIIVLGKKGSSNVKEVLLGGVAETVIHKSEIPVFLTGMKAG